jgi:hypothetical protein
MNNSRGKEKQMFKMNTHNNPSTVYSTKTKNSVYIRPSMINNSLNRDFNLDQEETHQINQTYNLLFYL